MSMPLQLDVSASGDQIRTFFAEVNPFGGLLNFLPDLFVALTDFDQGHHPQCPAEDVGTTAFAALRSDLVEDINHSRSVHLAPFCESISLQQSTF